MWGEPGVLNRDSLVNSADLNVPNYEELQQKVYMDQLKAQPMFGQRDLLQALERHQKKEDLEKDLENILYVTRMFLEEGNCLLDLGGSIKVHTLVISNGSVEIWLEDPESNMRYYKCTKENLLGSKDIREVIIRAIQG